MNNDDFKKYFPFPSARPKQRKIIDAITKSFDSGKKLVILCAPTAIGKSAIGVTLSNYYKSSYVVTSQKTLQDQYMNDFSKIGMKLIKGRNNYVCDKNPKFTCDAGHCSRGNKGCEDCVYKVARKNAYNSSMMVTNYSYFIGMNFSDFEKHSPRNLLILDECIRKGQYVKTINGNKKIEDITMDDKVLSYNVEDKKYEYKQVEKCHKNLHKSNSYNHFLQIELEDGTILDVTPNHKIFTSNRGYVRADELNENDDVIKV